MTPLEQILQRFRDNFPIRTEDIEAFITEAWNGGKIEGMDCEAINCDLHSKESYKQGFAAAIGKVKGIIPEKAEGAIMNGDIYIQNGYNRCRSQILQHLTLIEESTV